MSERIAFLDAYHVMNGDAARAAKKDFQTALYKSWLDCDTEKEREKLHSIAVGAEMFWRIMDDYAKKGKPLAEGLDERYEDAIRAVD